MPKITYTDSSGTARTVEADLGSTVMETAIRNNIPGIEAACGGACACATCHVYVDDAWRGKTGEKSAMEESMLDFAENVEENSRLSCQIKVSDELDGLTVRMPESQHEGLPTEPTQDPLIPAQAGPQAFFVRAQKDSATNP